MDLRTSLGLGGYSQKKKTTHEIAIESCKRSIFSRLNHAVCRREAQIGFSNFLRYCSGTTPAVDGNFRKGGGARIRGLEPRKPIFPIPSTLREPMGCHQSTKSRWAPRRGSKLNLRTPLFPTSPKRPNIFASKKNFNLLVSCIHFYIFGRGPSPPGGG